MNRRLIVGLVLSFPFVASATWTEIELPSLSGIYSPHTVGHLSDGRHIYAEGGQFFLQDTWGGTTHTAFSGEPGGTDPSFIAVISDTTAVAGGGGFGSSSLYTFNPTDPATPAFAATSYAIQNYQGVLRDSTSAYVGGLYSGFTHGISYASLTSAVTSLIIANVSTFSAGMAIDLAGNLFVGDTDDGTVRKFTVAQLDAAIGGATLAMGDGELVYDFGDGGNIGSLAVDAQGRIWAAGYLHNGLRVFDPILDAEITVIPGFDNANYSVFTFLRGGDAYVAYINQENPATALTDMRYGYTLASSIVVPEPGSMALAFAGVAVILIRLRRAQA